jgi:superfamily II DNA/RNA helicase
MHRAGRVGRYKTKGDSFVIYTKNIDPQIARLTKKNINFHYQFINQEGKLINKPLKLRKKQPLRFDDETNHAIKKIV